MNKPPHRIEYIAGPDKQGNIVVDVFWMSDYHPGHPDGEYGWRERGQVFKVTQAEIDRRWGNVDTVIDHRRRF